MLSRRERGQSLQSSLSCGRDDAPDHVTLPLSERFQALIDSLAMQLGLAGEDAYLEQWGVTDGERVGSAREVGAAVVAELEERFPEITARAFGRV